MENKKLLSVRGFRVLLYFGGCFLIVLGIAVFSARNPLLYILLAICLAIVIAGIIYVYWELWKPYVGTTRKVGAFAARGAVEDLQQIEYSYNQQFESMRLRIISFMENSNSLELSKRQAQYLALQNQINPHFLYNTLESIRSEALISGLDSVGDMCEALATFFRYTISNQKSLVTVEEEIQNITTYFYIQRYRFGKRLHLMIEYEGEEEIIRKCLIPKLALQPIVENAIIHGIEQKIGDGLVKVHLFITPKRLVIHVSDDGVGIEGRILDQINQHMVDRSVISKERGGIAIANVNNRIKMMFGEEFGLTVYSTVGIGTDVEINLPYSIECDEEGMSIDEDKVKCEMKY